MSPQFGCTHMVTGTVSVLMAALLHRCLYHALPAGHLRSLPFLRYQRHVHGGHQRHIQVSWPKSLLTYCMKTHAP
jgi:hypothetical protein